MNNIEMSVNFTIKINNNELILNKDEARSLYNILKNVFEPFQFPTYGSLIYTPVSSLDSSGTYSKIE